MLVFCRGSVSNDSLIEVSVMRITRIKPVEHRMFPIEFKKYDQEKNFPYFIDRDEHMENISLEKHEADFKTFIDGIYENRPKGFAVTCKGRFFGYEKPEEAKAGHRKMISRTQLFKWANSVYRKAHFEEKEYSLEGEYYYLRRKDYSSKGGNVNVEPTGAYQQVHCTSVDELTSGNPTWCTMEYITKDNIFTNGEGVFFLEEYSSPCIFFNKKEVAEKFAAQVNEGNFQELKKLSNDAWSAIQALHAAEKRAEDKAREAERQERIKTREAKEAERLSKVDKDSLVLSKDCIALGNWYAAIVDGNIRRFMAAGSHEGTTVGVYQVWSGSSYDETLNAELKWFLVEGPVFGSVDDARDYQKLSSH